MDQLTPGARSFSLDSHVSAGTQGFLLPSNDLPSMLSRNGLDMDQPGWELLCVALSALQVAVEPAMYGTILAQRCTVLKWWLPCSPNTFFKLEYKSHSCYHLITYSPMRIIKDIYTLRCALGLSADRCKMSQKLEILVENVLPRQKCELLIQVTLIS